jgi:hypothetical protein
MASINMKAQGKAFTLDGMEDSEHLHNQDTEDFRFMRNGRVVIKDHRGVSIIYGLFTMANAPIYTKV